ncbi:MAG: zinc ribbon domain-containing protein [Planctomycetes bacterium]|nr:zinc ribbon domain-containing protein [Planctomycetota bacterium]NOG54302.1 zinc ribbon domain-containing protein [Planctomycetota bacterium]
MPTYEYVCRACNHDFELFQSMSAPVKRKCPECGKKKLERLIGTGSAIIFKGSGFYETDYRSDSYKKAAKAEKSSTTSSSSSSSNDSSSSSNGTAKSDSTKKVDASKPAAASSGTTTGTKS